MRKCRVLVLMHKELIPPDTDEGVTLRELHKWKMEFDVVQHLKKLGHDVLMVGVEDELAPIRLAIEAFDPHVVFNLLGHFQGITLYDAYVVSWLELRRMAYTGCNPRGLLLSSDKVMAKKVLSWHRIPMPGFRVFPRGLKVKAPRRLPFPLFVKSAAEHASIGIAQASIVHDEDALRERVTFIHERIGTDALAESYVEGRELYVGVLGNRRVTVLPIWELTFKSLPRGTKAIATSRLKWDVDYQEKVGADTGPAKGLDAALTSRIHRLARRIYRALGLSGYARIDLRLDAEGRVFVLEANANPDLSLDEDLALSAAEAGIAYPDLIQRVMNLGMKYAPPWKGEG
jgi:D-alanine-D-alanine ligase